MILNTLSSGWHIFENDIPSLSVSDWEKGMYIVFLNTSCNIYLTIGNESKVIVYILCTENSPQKIEIFQEGRNTHLEVFGMYASKNIDLETMLDIRISGKGHSSHTRLISMVESGQVNISGNLHIAEKSQKINARLDLENIFLGDTGKIHSLPNLFIRSNDIVAGHSSKTWRMSEETLFYLTSRGLSRSDAQKLLQNGYFEQTFGNIVDNNREVYERLVSIFQIKNTQE